MIEDAWWIMDPEGHREVVQKEQIEWMKEEESGVAKFAMGVDLPLDEWVCDFCNDDIQLESNGVKQMVPMLGSYALCQNCLTKQIKKHTPENSEMLRKGKFTFSMWANRFCSCEPCVARFKEVVSGG